MPRFGEISRKNEALSVREFSVRYKFGHAVLCLRDVRVVLVVW